jgi:hypothetical protein
MSGLALMTVEVTISDLRNTRAALGGPQHEGADAMACALARRLWRHAQTTSSWR